MIKITNKTFYENESWEEIYNSLSQSFRSYLDTEEKFLMNRVKNGERILDIGSGTGRTIDSMLTAFSSSHITGIDIAAATVTA
ncbi:MAG: class I SAM-dependent methyltransferase, partial [Nanoarchaeota archaeon]